MISKTVRDALKTQLSASGSGLNDRLAALATTYSQTAYVIDWTATSTNFIFGRVAPEKFEESSVFTYPLLTIDTVRSLSTNRIKYGSFSGQVTAMVEVHHSWAQEAVIADFASLVDMTEDATISCLNDKAHQTWTGNLLWNGAVTLMRGPIAMGGYGWLQSISFTCQFDLTV
jgi:hypothetical protein